ncbi:MAG: hypothetical protein GX248_08290 [Peptococcaceae bacterium]|nr:hypothetical protein [Peptococcaceae bacterium]
MAQRELYSVCTSHGWPFELTSPYVLRQQTDSCPYPLKTELVLRGWIQQCPHG